MIAQLKHYSDELVKEFTQAQVIFENGNFP